MSAIKEIDQSTKRLFVGGFCGNINENELRARFKSFGQVSSVEIVSRRDEQGNPIKTFAYVDLGTSDAQLKKCISLLNNTKWKGNQMKVQLAKENFLTRLKREQKEKTTGANSNHEKVLSKDISHKPLVPEQRGTLPVPGRHALQKGIPTVLAGAVPGTPLPGKRNWVVSKFSRVLPVVYLRRRDKRKVAKFDPSKTAHNIKRLKSEGVQVSCTELTWSLEDKKCMKSRSHSPTKETKRKVNTSVPNSRVTSKTRIYKLAETHRDKDKCLDKESKNSMKNKKRKLQETDDTSTVKGHSTVQNTKSNAKNYVTLKYSDSDATSEESDVESEFAEKQSELLTKELKKNKKINGTEEFFNYVGLMSGNSTDKLEEGSAVDSSAGNSVNKSEEKSVVDSSSDDNVDNSQDRNAIDSSGDNSVNKSEEESAVDSSGDNSVDSSEEESAASLAGGNSVGGSEDGSAVSSSSDISVDSSDEESVTDSSNDNGVDGPKKDSATDLCGDNGVVSAEDENAVDSSYDISVDSSDGESAVDLSGDNSVYNSEKEDAVDLSSDKSVDISENGSSVDSSNDNSADSSDEESTVDLPGSTSVDNSEKEDAVDLPSDKSVDSSENGSTADSSKDNSVDSSEEENDVETASTSRWTKREKTIETNEKKELKFDESGHQSPKDKNNNVKDIRKRKSSVRNQTSKNLASEDATGSFTGSIGKKQLDSNEKRLDALKERQKSADSRKSLVHLALQNLDSSSSKENLKRGHIVFDDDPYGRQVNEESNKVSTEISESRFPSNKKISGSQAASWLGFDSDESDGEHSSEDENDEMFSLKPQFEGKAGERLFRLQKSFGRDQRFQLDKRFLESDEESDDDQAESSARDTEEKKEEGDAVSKQLAEERRRSLAVLQKVLGRSVSLNINSKITEDHKTTSEFGSLHYDPTREDHKQLEENVKKTASAQDPEPPTSSTTEPRQEDEAGGPQVSTDRFYDVNTSSLADMFGGKGDVADKQQTPFTFLPQEESADSCEPSVEPQQEAQMETLGPRPWAAQMLPYDSSDDEIDNERADDGCSDTAMASDENRQESVPRTELFFFHAEDPQLANRLNDESAAMFMRTESVEELTKHWETVRSQLTRDYKRKHKDATRRKNKIAAKRNKR